jgi:transposase
MTLLPPGREGALGLRLYRHAQGHRWARDAGAGRAAAGFFSGHLFVYRGRKANLIKIVFWDGTGLCLFTKRLEHGVFLWPSNVDPGGALMLNSTPAVDADRRRRLARARAVVAAGTAFWDFCNTKRHKADIWLIE